MHEQRRAARLQARQQRAQARRSPRRRERAGGQRQPDAAALERPLDVVGVGAVERDRAPHAERPAERQRALVVGVDQRQRLLARQAPRCPAGSTGTAARGRARPARPGRHDEPAPRPAGRSHMGARRPGTAPSARARGARREAPHARRAPARAARSRGAGGRRFSSGSPLLSLQCSRCSLHCSLHRSGCSLRPYRHIVQILYRFYGL